MKCKNCGQEVSEGLFCENCGSRLEDTPSGAETKFICTGCGMEWEDGVMFCGECGSPVEKVTAPPKVTIPIEPMPAVSVDDYVDTTEVRNPVKDVPDASMVTGKMKTTMLTKEPLGEKEIADREEGKKFWHKPEDLI